jgi:uncharacterized membrane protein
MNGAQLHLALNHFPVVLSFVSLALIVWGLKSGSPELRRAALVFVIAGAVFSGIAYLTGEPAEDVLKNTPYFTKALVHEHEEAAEFALIFHALSGLVAISALFFSKRNAKIASRLFVGLLVLGLHLCTVYLRTAHLGGLIRHEEIRESTPSPT